MTERPNMASALGLEPECLAGLTSMARLDAAAGRLTRAVETLEVATRLDPMNPENWELLAKLEERRGHSAKAEAIREVLKCLK